MAMKWAIAIMATPQSIPGASFRASAKYSARCPYPPASGHRCDAPGPCARLDLGMLFTHDHKRGTVGGHPNDLRACEHDFGIGGRPGDIRLVARFVKHKLVAELDAVVR